MIKIIELLSCTMAVSLLTHPVPVSAEDDHESSILVAMGDSYSSGEGVEPFYGETDDHVGEPTNDDWTAHRSEKAWSGQLVLPGNNGQTMSELKGDKWYFVAASGAETKDFANQQTKSFNHHGQTGYDSY